MRQAAPYLNEGSASGLNRLEEIISIQRGVIRGHIHLIASACYPFNSVLRASAEPSFILPVEGMPGERYLPGAQTMDIVEREGEQLILDLFNRPSGYRASLQPHSGTQANQIAYNAVLEPDDTVLCLNAKSGGHISHTVLISRRHKTINYGVTTTGYLDYDQLLDLAATHQPKLIIVGGSALPRAIDFARCSEIAHSVGAYLHADISHTATFIAASLHPPVFPHCDFATFNMSKNLRGPNSGVIMFRDQLTAKIYGSIFPTTQGGANETGMLGKFAALLEWQARDIKPYASSIIAAAHQISLVLVERGMKVMTGGTDCHIVMLDLADQEKSGADFEREFEAYGVLLNRNLIPEDIRPPTKTSGLRIGTTNLAILGYEVSDIHRLAHWIADIIVGQHNDTNLIRYLLRKYPFERGIT